MSAVQKVVMEINQREIMDALRARDIPRLKAFFQDDEIEALATPGMKVSQLLAEAIFTNRLNIVKGCLLLKPRLTEEVGVAAAEVGNIEVYRLLIAAGLDINQELFGLGDALAVAVTDNKKELVQFLLENGATPKKNGPVQAYGPLTMAIVRGDLEVVDLLAQHGADIKQPGLLHTAAKYGLEHKVQYLISKGVDINQVAKSDSSSAAPAEGSASALHVAAIYGRSDIVHLLLDSGASLTVLDSKQQTPLKAAMEAGQRKTAEILALAESQEVLKAEESANAGVGADNDLDSITHLKEGQLSVGKGFGVHGTAAPANTKLDDNATVVRDRDSGVALSVS